MNNQDTNAITHIDDEFFTETQELLDEDFKDLVTAYMDDALNRVDLLNIAIAQNDHSSGYELAHSLKGASANLGLIHLSDLCHQLQEVFREQVVTEYSDLVAKVSEEVVLTNREIIKRLS